jgi:hypothetical protein
MQGDIGCELEMLQGQDLPHFTSVGPYSGNARGGLACYPPHKVSVLCNSTICGAYWHWEKWGWRVACFALTQKLSLGIFTYY